MIFAGLILMAVLAGMGIYYLIQDHSNFDIERDYKEIKTALAGFKKEHTGYTQGIEHLKSYLKAESTVKLDRYILSFDDRFLLVKRLPKNAVPRDIAKRIGGKSSYSGSVLKLSFLTSANDIEPIAEISIKPMRKITTTTRLEYSNENSKVIDNRIRNTEWLNNREYFDEKGTYTVKMRVQDKNARWSKWVSKQIFISEDTGVNSILGCGEHLFVSHRNGYVEAYGENNYGQFGNGSNQRNKAIKKVENIKRVDQLASSTSHTLFLKSDRTVCAAGLNDYGQLGKGDCIDSKIPMPTWGMSNIIQVACGESFSAAVTSDGYVYTWGKNLDQCLGHNKKSFIEIPMKVEEVSNVKQISLGHNFVLALCYDGTVYSWGANDFGQLGLGFKSKSQNPSVSSLKNIKYIEAGKGFSYALDHNGLILGFGLNNKNQLGFEGEKEVLFPREMSKLKSIIKIVTRNNFTLALEDTGKVYSWGQFSSNQKEYDYVPKRSETLLYIKDITASSAYGYSLNENDEVYQFTSGFKDLKKIDVDHNKDSQTSSQED